MERYRVSSTSKVLFVLVSLGLWLDPVTGLFSTSLLPLARTRKALAGAPDRAKIRPVTRKRVRKQHGELPLTFEANRGQSDPQVEFLARNKGYTVFLTPAEAVLVFSKPAAKQKAPEKTSRVREIMSDAAVADLTVLRMRLVGASPAPESVGLEKMPGTVHYFIGNDPEKWCRNVPTYAKVKYEAVYPGVDLVYYGNKRQLEYDFVVAPGVDPAIITLAFQGVEKLEINGEGELLLRTKGGEIRHRKPHIYQKDNGVERVIPGRYVLKGKKRVGFHVAAHDADKPLVIDPVLFYSTYLGGNGLDLATSLALDPEGNVYVTGATLSTNFPGAAGSPGGSLDVFVTKMNAAGSALVYSAHLGGTADDQGFGITVDGLGHAYLTGSTASETDFPTLDPFQAACVPSPPQPGQPGSGCLDAFVAKVLPDGSNLVYSSYLGGAGTDAGFSVGVDLLGHTYVAGATDSNNFPDAPRDPPDPADLLISGFDAFVTKVSAARTALFPGPPVIIYTTLLGGTAFNPENFGSGDDAALAITVAAAGEGSSYVTGFTASTNFHRTQGSYQTIFNGAVDAFMTQLNASTGAVEYSTLFGGSGIDLGEDIDVDGFDGNVYVTGYTTSTDFPDMAASPIQPAFGGGVGDGFVVKLDPVAFAPASSQLVYATYLGGGDSDAGRGIAADTDGNAYVTGATQSTDFPTLNPFQPAYGGRPVSCPTQTPVCGDSFVAMINPAGSALVYSSYLGGSDSDAASAHVLFERRTPTDLQGILIVDVGNSIAVQRSALDPSCDVYVTGSTQSADFPGTAGGSIPAVRSPIQGSLGGGGFDAYVAKIIPGGSFCTGGAAAVYPCDEGSGSTVFDFSGNDNDGSNVGVTYSSDTPFPAMGNRSLEFDDGADAITIPAGPGTNVHSYQELTLEAFIKPTSTSGLHFILWADDGPFSLFINNDTLGFGLIGSSGSTVLNVPFTASGVWTHIAGAYDGTTATLYVGGAEATSGAAALGTITVSSGPENRNVIRIGNDETADCCGVTDRDFGGLIDEVQIHDQALDASEILLDASTKACNSAVANAQTVTLKPGGGGGDLTEDALIEFTNGSGSGGASVKVGETSSDLHPTAVGGFGALGNILITETSLNDGEFFMTVTIPFEQADLGGSDPLSVDITWYDASTNSWILAVAANTQPSPGYPGPIGDRFPESGTLIETPTLSQLSNDLGDYGVFWNTSTLRGFAWANVDHTTDFSPGISSCPECAVPGDCNRDAALDISDAVCALGVLFTGMPATFPCGDGSPTHPGNIALMDWQPDGGVDISDAVSMLRFLFGGDDAHPLAVPGSPQECVIMPGCLGNPSCQ